MANAQYGQHAIVMGGSLGGLMAARVLSDHFQRVTIVERDRIPDGSIEPHKGAPHARHAHGLLLRGLQIMQDLFPSMWTEMLAGGAVELDVIKQCRWFHFGGYKASFDSGMMSTFQTRPFMEMVMRRQVLKLPNVTILDGCGVESLVTTDDRSRVTGIQTDESNGAPRELRADLVVDATGRACRAPRWLEELGYAKPSASVVRINFSPVSRLYKRDPGDNQRAFCVLPNPPVSRVGGYAFPVEGDRWIVSLAGWSGHHAEAADEPFLEFAKRLDCRDVYNIVKDAEPIGDYSTFKFPAATRYHYEGMASFPDGYLVLGDAVAHFNPIYGQGMSCAAIGAETLRACLVGLEGQSLHGTQLWRKYFTALCEAGIEAAWMVSTGEDLRYPEIEGVRTPQQLEVNAYLEKVHHAAKHDHDVMLAFMKAQCLVAQPTSLFHPDIIARVTTAERAGLGPRMEVATDVT